MQLTYFVWEEPIGFSLRLVDFCCIPDQFKRFVKGFVRNGVFMNRFKAFNMQVIPVCNITALQSQARNITALFVITYCRL
jgi:hypothetical protein